MFQTLKYLHLFECTHNNYCCTLASLNHFHLCTKDCFGWHYYNLFWNVLYSGHVWKKGKKRQNFFEIPALLSWGKFRVGKFKITYIFLIFPLCFMLNFLLVGKIKEWEFQKHFRLSVPTLFLYIPWYVLDRYIDLI